MEHSIARPSRYYSINFAMHLIIFYKVREMDTVFVQVLSLDLFIFSIISDKQKLGSIFGVSISLEKFFFSSIFQIYFFYVRV